LDLSARIKAEADRCVKCGICLPHCPTYKLYNNEGESPRGRIALIHALTKGELTSTHAEEHLNHCLNCLACEKACPSSVNYGELIDLYRQAKTEHRDTRPSALTMMISKLPYNPLSTPLYWAYRHLGLRTLARLLLGRRFRRLDNLLPQKVLLTPLTAHPPLSPSTLRIGLFTGCIARITERAPLLATIKVLEQLNVDVVIPNNQTCCGALHQRSGHSNEARRLEQANHNAFNAKSLDAIIYTASGCGAQLSDSGAFDTPVMEICQFLAQIHWPADSKLAQCSEEALLHTPCTLKNNLGKGNETSRLLEKIPGLKLTHTLHGDCCGAGGSIMVEHPVMSGQLRTPLIEDVALKAPHWLLTSNTGCAMHLRAGILEAQLNTRVIHPIELIERQLTRAKSTSRNCTGSLAEQ